MSLMKKGFSSNHPFTFKGTRGKLHPSGGNRPAGGTSLYTLAQRPFQEKMAAITVAKHPQKGWPSLSALVRSIAGRKSKGPAPTCNNTVSRGHPGLPGWKRHAERRKKKKNFNEEGRRQQASSRGTDREKTSRCRNPGGGKLVEHWGGPYSVGQVGFQKDYQAAGVTKEGGTPRRKERTHRLNRGKGLNFRGVQRWKTPKKGWTLGGRGRRCI